MCPYINVSIKMVTCLAGGKKLGRNRTITSQEEPLKVRLLDREEGKQGAEFKGHPGFVGLQQQPWSQRVEVIGGELQISEAHPSVLTRAF